MRTELNELTKKHNYSTLRVDHTSNSLKRPREYLRRSFRRTGTWQFNVKPWVYTMRNTEYKYSEMLLSKNDLKFDQKWFFVVFHIILIRHMNLEQCPISKNK